jgi:hypothetical protein
MVLSDGAAICGGGLERVQASVLERLGEVFRSAPMVEMLGIALSARLREAVEAPIPGFRRALLELRHAVRERALRGAPSSAMVGAMQAMWHVATAQAKRLSGESDERQMASLVRATEAVSRTEAEVIALIRARRRGEFRMAAGRRREEQLQGVKW